MPRQKKFLFEGLFFFLIIVFFALYIRSIDFQSLNNLHVNWILLALASLTGLAFRYCGVMIWRFILKDLGAKVLPSFIILADVYAKAWMARYIPGTLPWITGKVYLASRAGISKSRLAVASLLEGSMQIVAIMIVSLLLISFDRRLDVVSTNLKIFMIVFSLVMLLLLSPAIFNRLLGLAYRMVKRRPAGEELRTNKRAISRAFALYGLGAFISGTSYFLFTAAIWPDVSWSMYFYLVGAFNLAGAIGMAAPFVPSGLGVREGIQLVLLSAIFPKDVALVITVSSRLWSASVDVLFYALANAIRRLRY